LALLPFLLLGANCLFFRTLAFDDAWITFRYARNLTAGRGLVFNPSDAAPSEGFTSIFHVLACALGMRAGIHPLVFTRLVNFLLLCGLPFLALKALRRNWPNAAWLSLIPLAFFLSANFTAWQASTGMETIFFVCGAFLLALLAADLALRPSLARGALLGLAGCGLLIVRPEGGLLFAVHLALLAVSAQLPGFRRRLQLAAVAGGSFALCLGAFIGWKWFALGHLLPNSYYVKTRGGVFGLPPQAWPGLSHVVQYFTDLDQGMPQAVLILLVLLLLRPTAARSRAAATLLAHNLVPVAALLAYYLRIIHESCMFRLEFTAMLPLLFSASVLLAAPEGLRPSWGSLNQPALRAFVALVAGFALLAAHPWNLRHLPGLLGQKGPLPNDTIQVQLGEDLKRTGLGDSLVMLTGAVGIVPFLSDITTVDWVGLTDNFFSGRTPESPAALQQYYRSRHPDVICAKWAPAAASRKEDDPAFQGMLRGLRGKYPEGLMVRLYQSEAFLEFVHGVMTDLAASYEIVAVYGDGPYVIYVRKDSNNKGVVRRAFEASPYVLRGIDPANYVSMKARAGEMDPY